jgi:hypothetical protein
MTTDRYTKAVLTIIAGALLYIGAMLSGPPASAQGQGATQGSPGMVMDARPQPVVVVRWAQPDRPWPVAIQSVSEPLPVTLRPTSDQPLPVTITGVKAGAQWDEIRVKQDPSYTLTPVRP